MSKTFSKFALAAGIVLAMAFTFSCSGDDGGTDEPSSSSAENPSSSGIAPSSSSIPSSSGTTPSSSSDTPSSSGTASSSSSLPSSSSQAIVPVYGEPITDARDGKTYETVVIGTQTWMAKNLDFEAESSKCYNDDPANCVKYGRLYNWVTAMNLPLDCNSIFCSSQISSPHQGICPSGWHLPTQAELEVLGDDAKKLKATSGWSSNTGTNDYGFSALPGGFGGSDGYFYDVGHLGSWWSAGEGENFSENTSYYEYTMSYGGEYVSWYNYDRSNLFDSVRCLQD